MGSDVVLVTGGCGFLGQHVIKHLQLYAEQVTEIRVLDLIPFKRKLEYDGHKTVTSIIGNITDTKLVTEACQGVTAVFHLASKIDVSLFPDNKALYNINVRGTENIIKVCKQENVQYLIYCGSIGSFYGYDEVENGTETSVQIPNICAHGKYGETKRIALEIVMKAHDTLLSNGKAFRTIGILPPGMFGELDPHNVRTRSRFVRDGIYYRLMGALEAKIQYSYVGNVSMMFLQAYESLQKNSNCGGQYYFAVDDTPSQSHIAFRRPYLRQNIKISSWHIPRNVICSILCIIYYVLLFVRPFKSVNLPLSSDVVYYLNTTFYVTYDKAKTVLGYKPLYDYQTSVERTKMHLHRER